METTTSATPAVKAVHPANSMMSIMEVFEQMQHGKVSGDNWMVDECGNLKIMLHNHTVENLDETSSCCQDMAVFDVKVMIATNCLQKKAWKRGIEYAKHKYAENVEEYAEFKEEEEHHHSPKEIIINL